MVEFKDLEKNVDEMIEQVATIRGICYDVLQNLHKQKKGLTKGG